MRDPLEKLPISGTLDDFVTWQSGGTPPKDNPKYWTGDIPWLTPKDMKSFDVKETSDYLTSKGVVAGSKVAPATATYIVVRGMILAHTFPVSQMPEAAAFNQDVKAVVPGDCLLPRFLAYWLQGHASEFLRMVSESTHGTKKLDLVDLQRFPLDAPSIPEQARIVETLTAIDDQIRATGRIIEKRRGVHHGLLQCLFDGSKPDLSPVPIGVLADTYAGGTPSRSVPGFYGGGIPWVKSGEVNRSSIEWTEETISAAALQSSSARWVPAGVPVVAMYGATAGAVSWTRIRVTTNQAVLAIVPRTDCVSARWLYWALVNYSPAILASVQGSGQPNLSKKTIDRFIVRAPSHEGQTRIAEILDASQEELEAEAALLHKLQQKKAGLMTDLVTGRVRVPERAVP